MYLGCNLFQEDGESNELEFEIDNSKFQTMMENGVPFSKEIGLVTSPCIALKHKVKVKENSETTLNLVISVSENLSEIEQNLDYYKSQENVKTEFNIARAKSEEEVRYLSLSHKDLTTFQSLLPYILFQNPMKAMYMGNLPKNKYRQSDFWKYGISGDLPIMLVLIKSVNDVYVANEMLKAHEYFRIKGIKTDLIILDYERNVYEQYVKEQVMQEILNMQIGYLLNISGGIFLLNKNEIEDEDLFKFRANIVISANKGSVYDEIKEMEEDYILSKENIGDENKKATLVPEFEEIKPNIDFDKLKFYNSIGGFTEDGKEYVIKMNKEKFPPVPWSNILANQNFGTVVTSNMGGYTWSKNCRLNRISSWVNDPNADIPSEIIYMKDLGYGRKWSLNFSPMPDDKEYYAIYGLGYAKFYHACLGIIQECEIFVPEQDKVKVNIIRLKNTTSEKRNLKLVYYIKPVLRRGRDKN